MPPSDHALIEAFQGGDEFAFVALYNRYRGPVYAFCAKMLLDRAAAQDVMQEAFVRVYENRQRLLSAGSFKAYLFAIARNQCLNGLRRQGRHAPLPEAGPGAPAAAETPFGDLLKAEQVALVNRFLASLSPEYREVLVLREYQNLSYEEIAAVTRNTVSSVKSRLFKARRKLGQYLEPWLDPAEAPPAARPSPTEPHQKAP
ncbi:MAG TPA: RNA polymerase sigma factor [Rubricoccaceae bacterium]|nr:RNA polymerase sigma factor [Rubricoccaceae bacterium]